MRALQAPVHNRKKRSSTIVTVGPPQKSIKTAMPLLKIERLVLIRRYLLKEVKRLYIECLNKKLIIKRDIKFEFLKIKTNRLKIFKIDTSTSTEQIKGGHRPLNCSKIKMQS